MNEDCRDYVQPHLQPAERLLAVCECELAPGVPERPLWLRQPPQESEPERWIKSRLPGPVQRFLRPSEPKPVTRFERTMEGAHQSAEHGLTQAALGKGMHGGWESQAGQFLVAHYTAARLSATTLVVAFTDRRVLALADRAKLWNSGRAYELHWEAPRSGVLEVRANPKGVFQRGRFELVFVDESWIALVALVPTHAKPFAAQVGISGPQGHHGRSAS